MSKTLVSGGKRTVSNRLSAKVFPIKNIKKIKSNADFEESGNKMYKMENQSDIIVVPLPYSSLRLNRGFFNKPCLKLCQTLLGKVLARKIESGEILRGKIVETESYLGVEDKASHSYQGKRTERNEAMFMQPGTAYVYSIYGMYYCFNISSLEDGSAVLIRALEPLNNATTMLAFRSMKRKGSKNLKVKDLCNGPSKLCQAFKIEKHLVNKVDLCTSEDLWLENGSDVAEEDIIACKRIGIDSAGEEAANKPFRFYVKDCPFVSIRNRHAETNILP